MRVLYTIRYRVNEISRKFFFLCVVHRGWDLLGLSDQGSSQTLDVAWIYMLQGGISVRAVE